ncbi:hypothetical protein K431DRAFT_65164 [Polychaeton citri CBS 116435]|uniref:Uncharacterized protein n=1 Tax=Polychaeton citri CBS 116435 TaxID=1314669 RepID=A0A9P4UPK3_9PEZI|nr:hypothetical protein K431DRAFT_65164 [Polychaeton citri CBS 116435]
MLTRTSGSHSAAGVRGCPDPKGPPPSDRTMGQHDCPGRWRAGDTHRAVDGHWTRVAVGLGVLVSRLQSRFPDILAVDRRPGGVRLGFRLCCTSCPEYGVLYTAPRLQVSLTLPLNLSWGFTCPVRGPSAGTLPEFGFKGERWHQQTLLRRYPAGESHLRRWRPFCLVLLFLRPTALS